MTDPAPGRSKRLTVEMAREALLQGFHSCRSSSASVDSRGYVDSPEANLIEGIDLDDFRDDFDQGSGNELAGKFRAIHSSSALAANCFGPFKRRPSDLQLADVTGFESVSFERKCPVGLRQARTPPNLDLLATRPDHIVAVESKLLEHFGKKRAKFADSYRDEITDSRRAGPWYAEMIRLRGDPTYYQHLDAAQLIKHAFGLANTFSNQNITLLYLYWEPTNGSEFDLLRTHREEIADFTSRIADGFPRFESVSYPELWTRWAEEGPASVAAHVHRMKERYGVRI